MLVSVIIPCFNVENYIVECLQSVLSQSHKNVEIICVDNNSTDSTWQTLQDLQTKYPQILIDKELKKGANAARNKGLKIANGQWIQFLDADDLIEYTKIEHQLHLISSGASQIGFVAASYTKKPYTGNGRVVKVGVYNPFVAPFINECGITSANLWNKTCLADVGGWNEDISSSQEAELMLRLILKDILYIVDSQPLTVIRERVSGQISQGDPEKKWKQYINVRLLFLDKLKDCNKQTYEKFQGIYYDFLMVSIFTLARYNKQSALKIYNERIKNNWVSAGTYGFSKFRVAVIKVIGLNQILLFKKLVH